MNHFLTANRSSSSKVNTKNSTESSIRHLLLGVAVLVTFGFPSSVAAAPEVGDPRPAQKNGGTVFTCATSSNGIAYCRYSGPVEMTYVNDHRQILIYLDPAVTSSHIQSEVEGSEYEAYWGQDIHTFNYVAARIPDGATESTNVSTFHQESQFADKLYAMLLTAQVSGRQIHLQMRGGHFGSLRVDRAWME